MDVYERFLDWALCQPDISFVKAAIFCDLSYGISTEFYQYLFYKSIPSLLVFGCNNRNLGRFPIVSELLPE